jgi:hypothetical protein
MLTTACRARCRSVPTIQGRRLTNGGRAIWQAFPRPLLVKMGQDSGRGPSPHQDQGPIAHHAAQHSLPLWLVLTLGSSSRGQLLRMELYFGMDILLVPTGAAPDISTEEPP